MDVFAKPKNVLAKLYENKTKHNVVFKVRLFEGEYQEFSANKLILSASSEIFEKMLVSPKSGQIVKEIKVEDVEPEAFEQLIRYLYLEEADFNEEAKDLQHVINTYHAANKYGIEGLEKLCANNLEKRLTPKNVLNIYSVSNDLNDQTLLKRCEFYMVQHEEAVFKSAEFDSISEQTLNFLLDSISSKVNALNVFEKVHSWCSKKVGNLNKLEADGDTDEQLLRLLEPFMKKIDILTIPSIDFFNSAKLMAILTKEQIVQFGRNLEAGTGEIPMWCSQFNCYDRGIGNFYGPDANSQNTFRNDFSDNFIWSCEFSLLNHQAIWLKSFTISIRAEDLDGLVFEGSFAINGIVVDTVFKSVHFIKTDRLKFEDVKFDLVTPVRCLEGNKFKIHIRIANQSKMKLRLWYSNIPYGPKRRLSIYRDNPTGKGVQRFFTEVQAALGYNTAAVKQMEFQLEQKVFV